MLTKSDVTCPECYGEGYCECTCCGSDVDCEDCCGTGCDSDKIDIAKMNRLTREWNGSAAWLKDGAYVGRMSLDGKHKVSFEELRHAAGTD